ncbi:MAG: glycoside hydrolase family 20 zincin-like fold domain-containing protein [Bryobacterales bacterium]|nr:glycoside hydrolase family 20 zincin-like fold domain-containing protein [Bryobacterales bacterium]
MRIPQLALLLPAFVWAKVSILPAPQYVEAFDRQIVLSRTTSVAIALHQPRAAQMQLAAQSLCRKLENTLPNLKVRFDESAGTGGLTIHLWDFSQDTNPPVPLTLLDRNVIAPEAYYGQGYVIRVPDANSLWIVGGSPQGVLYGSMSVLQLIEKTSGGAAIQAVYIRDYPHFEYRASSDWLLNIEINGWTWDRGRGVDVFARVMESKIDRALRYKINMALVDGFGFNAGKRPDYYPALMRRLNQYARARGIHLIHGGYGASYGMAYEPVVMYEQGVGFKGTVFENRLSYPNGETYRCMGFPKTRKGYDPAILGSCRSNEDLNRMKAKELRQYVMAVEPGALYIHHEDFGGFEGTQKAWLQRCERCRNRWPNDSLAAPDGGAGALAHGYSQLVSAVSQARNRATGFDGSRDTRVILVSPVYLPDHPSPESWSQVLELWRNIGLQLPKSDTIDVCFREVFPMKHGGERFTGTFRTLMQRAGLNLNIFLFFTGGADRFITDYPLTGAPSMNALFLGARGIYNSSGDAYQEPMELINAEYSWNANSRGSAKVPRTYDEARAFLRDFAFDADKPPEVFGPGGIYQSAVEHLYGAKAAIPMMNYYRESADLPERPSPPSATGRPMTYLPLTWDRMFAASSHWRQLIQDSKTWRGQVDDESFAAAVERAKLTQAELHRRLARRWRIASELNRKGLTHLQQALKSAPLQESVDDLVFLRTLRDVYQPLMDSLALYHRALHNRASGKLAGLQNEALALAVRAKEMAAEAFPEPIDPVGGEVGTLRKLSAGLVDAITEFNNR